jgi:hypothetical protein
MPGPPPISSMNSTPAISKARRTARSLASVMDVPSSTKVIGTRANSFGFVSQNRVGAYRKAIECLCFYAYRLANKMDSGGSSTRPAHPHQKPKSQICASSKARSSYRSITACRHAASARMAANGHAAHAYGRFAKRSQFRSFMRPRRRDRRGYHSRSDRDPLSK